MRKRSLLALLLAMTLLLSGCALIVKDKAVDDATVIIKMGDQTITKDKVNAEVQNQLDSMEYYYATYNMPFDRTDAAAVAQAREAAVNDLKQDLALTAKAKELGLDQLTPEEEEKAKQEAETSYNGALDYAKNFLVTDKTLEGEALDKAAEDALAGMGVTKESYVEASRKTAVDNKLRQVAIEGVTVTDEDIKAEYDKRVENDTSLYGEKPGSYATAVNNDTVVYNVPKGVRRVKQILVKFKEGDQTAIDEASQALTDAGTRVSAAQAKIDSANGILHPNGQEATATDLDPEVLAENEKDLETAQAELKEATDAQEAARKAVDDATAKAFANIDADADAILASLDAGEDWDKLMDEKNEDPGMKTHPKGYAVSADMTGFDPAFVEAAMALEKPGDHSGKVRGTSYGYYIIRYEGDEPEGPVPLEDVKETISSSLKTVKENEAYTAAVAKWVEEAGITVDMNALKD